MKKILGITSTIPIEIPIAAGRIVADLNNLFINSQSSEKYLKFAEEAGYPRTCCAWIKGIYGYVHIEQPGGMIFVTGGDCSNTQAMLETLIPELREIFIFAYPYPPDKAALKIEMERLCAEMGISLKQAEETGKRLSIIRKLLKELDILTWEDELVSGFENFQWLVSSSDFNSSPDLFESELRLFLDRVKKRNSRFSRIRLGLIGIPPVFSDFHDVVESLGAKIVLNEIPRQFAMLDTELDLVTRYHKFTYPYGVWPRIKDIAGEIEKRKINGLIHYTQSFCHRQIHDVLIRRELKIPVLTIEGENPSKIDQRTKLRIESFLEMLDNATEKI
ncbi:MAG: 2-hydroxyacyl-CoA dehydratase [Candidatus Riflebacteria bacterium]|nr:2-hydroxyacyl-CoA dehydratase [Candidatus Riflebacteria bacterium]